MNALLGWPKTLPPKLEDHWGMGVSPSPQTPPSRPRKWNSGCLQSVEASSLR